MTYTTETVISGKLLRYIILLVFIMFLKSFDEMAPFFLKSALEPLHFLYIKINWAWQNKIPYNIVSISYNFMSITSDHALQLSQKRNLK